MNTAAQILAVVTLAVVLFSLLKPHRVLSVYIITRPMIQPFIFLQQTLFGVPYSLLWAGILPVVYAINVFYGRWKIFCYKSLPLLAILALSILSMAVSVDLELSYAGAVKITCAVLAYGAAFNLVRGGESANKIITAIVLSSVIPLAFGLYQAVTGQYDQIYSSVTDRVNSVFGVGNAYGIYLTITMCAAIMLISQPDLKRNTRLFYIGLLAAMCASQVLALNRGTWIALVLAIGVSLLPYRRKVKIRWFVIGGLVLGMAFSGVIVKRLTETTYRYDGTEANTFQGRIDYWNYLMPQILEKPVLGHGIGTTGEVPGSRQPHNDYLRFAMDIGIVGSLLYIYFLVSLAWFFFSRLRTRRGRELWRYNFPMSVLNIYFIIISSTQNITVSFINFGFFLMLNGAIVRLNTLQSASVHVTEKKPLGLLVAHRQKLQSST